MNAVTQSQSRWLGVPPLPSFGEWAPGLVTRNGVELDVTAFVHPDSASYTAWLFQGVAWQFGGAYSDPDFTFCMTEENTVFWSKNTGYMPVRKSAASSEEMKSHYEEFPQFKTAVDQLEPTRPQDSARVWVPNGDQIIGKGLERVAVLGEGASTVFADVNETLVAKAAPVLESLARTEA